MKWADNDIIAIKIYTGTKTENILLVQTVVLKTDSYRFSIYRYWYICTYGSCYDTCTVTFNNSYLGFSPSSLNFL
jgi:hypothetical protein